MRAGHTCAFLTAILGLACSSSSDKPPPVGATSPTADAGAAADGAAPAAAGGACLEIADGPNGSKDPAYCTEYESPADYDAGQAACGHVTIGATWVSACPAGKVTGCKAPPGTPDILGAKIAGGFVVWTYSSFTPVTCNAPASVVTP